MHFSLKKSKKAFELSFSFYRLTNQLITRHSLEDFAEFNKGNRLKYHKPVKGWNLGPEESYFFRIFEYLSKIVLETLSAKLLLDFDNLPVFWF